MIKMSSIGRRFRGAARLLLKCNCFLSSVDIAIFVKKNIVTYYYVMQRIFVN